MKNLVLILLFSLFFIQGRGQAKTYQYCTNVGPVEVTLDDEVFTGKYLITVTPQVINGTLQGEFNDGLIDGHWDDPDGTGRIIIAFTGDLNGFTAVYNAPKRDPAHWYSEWRGISTTAYASLPAEKQKEYSCAWKK